MLSRRSARRVGSALIITLGVLFVLAILAISFSRIMIPERDAAKQYNYTVQARMAAHAGIERATAALRSETMNGTINGVNAGWIYWGEDKNKNGRDDPGEDSNLNGIVERVDCPIDVATTPSYQVGAFDYSGLVTNPNLPNGWTVRYKLKVVDSQGMINLNNDYRDFEEFLNHFGRYLQSYLGMSRNIVAGARYGGQSGARAITTYRASLPGGIFSSKRQLIQILADGERDLEKLDSYITVYSWDDPTAVSDARVVANPNWWNQQWNDFSLWSNGFWNFWGPAQPAAVKRYPININTATKPVLAAAMRTFVGYFPFDSSQGDIYDSNRMRASADYVLQAWRTWTSDGFCNAVADLLISHRSGAERDVNGDNWPDGAEDTNRNGILDRGPFRGSQDWSHFIQTYIGYGTALQSAMNPNAMLQRYNPDFMPTAWFHQRNNSPWFHIADVFLSDKCYIEKQPPEITFRSHGFFEVSSLGTVYDDKDQQVSSKMVRTVVQSYWPFRQATQKDFMSKPSGTAWNTGDPYPSTPWTSSDYNNWCVGTTSYPENIWDNVSGSKTTAQPAKASQWDGGVQLAPLDDPTATMLFSNFRHSGDANVGPSAVAGSNRNWQTGSAIGLKHIEDRSVHDASTQQASDLFSDGLYHNMWRRYRSTTYLNGGYNLMRPDQGTQEMWWKPETHWFGGEIFTAFLPADPSVEASDSTEGIQHRIYLGYVPFRCGFGGCVPIDQPYRWHGAPEVQSSRGVLCVPCVVAERKYYTAQVDLPSGQIHGRDCGYGGLGTLGAFGNGAYVFRSTNWLDYEYFPMLNWGRDKMWHHLLMTWVGGTDISFYMDGVRAPYRTTVGSATWGAGSIVLPWWGYRDMPPEIHVGGTCKVEVPLRGLSLAGGFGASGGMISVVHPRPLRYWYDTTLSRPTDWHSDSTLDWVRVYGSPSVGARLNRFEPIGAGYVGAYRNQIKMPDDAGRITYFAWDPYIPCWDPKIDAGPYYYGRYIFPQNQPDIVMEIRTAAGTYRLDEATLMAAPFSLTAQQAADAIRGGGVAVNLPVTGGETITYTAYFRNKGNLNPLQVTPILESVSLFYFTRAPKILMWEEY